MTTVTGILEAPGEATVTAITRPHRRSPRTYPVGVTVPKPRVEPLDPPMVPFALAGMAAFAIAAVIVWLADGPHRWLVTCFAGVAVGIPGLITMIVHDRHRRRRRALSHPEFRIDA